MFPITITTPHSYLTYLDANNLYGGATSEALPIADFTFLAVDEVASFDLNATMTFDDYGYILEVGLKYPEHLHDTHSDYPLATDKLRIMNDILSAYSSFLISKHVTSEKLSPNLYDKTKYVVHCENLRLYLKHGFKLVKVHGILKFRQSAWIKSYIDFNTAKRRAAKSSFLQFHYKNLNNMLFGKTTESLRKRINLELVTNPTRAKKLIAKPTTLHWDIISEKIIVSRPIYLGFCILELSKITMYKLHYEEIMGKYGSRPKLAYTDTDSFIYHIKRAT